MRYFLGIDVGSSKTHALICDENGRCIGFGKAGGGNYQGIGYDGLAKILVQAFQAASQMAGVLPGEIAGAGFGIAGYDFPSDLEPHLKAIAGLGLSCPVEVVNDGVNGLMAGTTHGVGVNVTAGSSVNVRGRGPDGKEGRIVGNGMTFGEFGGSAEIIWKGLHMVNYAWIQRIPATALTAIYLEETSAQSEIDLMEGLSNDQYHIPLSVSIQIFEAARSGDTAAIEVLRWAGEELAWLAISVARQIGMDQQTVEIVQSGSVFKGGEPIDKPMRRLIHQYMPSARLIHLDCPPVVGAVILGMQAAMLDGYAVRPLVIQTAKELIKE